MKIIIIPFLYLLLFFSVGCSSTNKTLVRDKSNLSEVGQAFSAISGTPVVFKIQKDTFTAPIGGHIQGIQQLDKRHLVISGSSKHKAYFFIAEMKGITRVKRRGIIRKVIYINDDFSTMRHNHASGIQVVGNLLAIGTEGGRDSNKSSVVFYDLTDRENPKPLGIQINRQEDTAGAIGLTNIGVDSLLLAVGGWDSNRIDFYLSPNNLDQLDFKLWTTWHTNSRNINGWIDSAWGRYQSLNFVKDNLDNLFLLGFYQGEIADMIADLYQVNLTATPAKLLQKIGVKRFYAREGASFKNGAGLSTVIPKRLNILATERNWSSLIRLNYW